MKRGILLGLSLLLLAPALPIAAGNEAPPPNVRPQKILGQPAPKIQEVKLVVQVDEKARAPRLQVPLGLLYGPGVVPPAPAPQRGADAGRVLPTVVAGVALTLAFVSAGLWLARRRHGRTLALLGVLSLFAAGTAAVWADLGPRPLGPRRERIPPPPALPNLKLPASIALSEKLVLEATLDGDHVTLIVPKTMVPEKEKAAASSAEKRTP